MRKVDKQYLLLDRYTMNLFDYLADTRGPCDLCIHALVSVPGGTAQAVLTPGWSWVDTLGDPPMGKNIGREPEP